jgi:hypothetical protein
MTNLKSEVEARFKIFIVRIITNITGVEEMSSHHISTKWMKLEKSSSFVNPYEYVHFVKD